MPVVHDLDVEHGDEAVADHLVDDRQDALDAVGAVDDLDDQR